MKLAENDVALLQKYLKKTVPDFGNGGMVWDGNEEEDQASQNINLEGSLQENSEDGMQQDANQDSLYHQEQRHVFEPRDFPQSMRRGPTSGNVVVGGYAIGAGHGLPTFECRAKRKRKKHCRSR